MEAVVELLNLKSLCELDLFKWCWVFGLTGEFICICLLPLARLDEADFGTPDELVGAARDDDKDASTDIYSIINCLKVKNTLFRMFFGWWIFSLI